ncbi:hypothetical protein RRF57_002216 [Xylaria bambusicola]|uniref:Uncharacterized protein n=1 Tax=Xylaria bambusicola TaxID=326684 RepID=A0AAN7UJY8_9PEZI
MPTGRADLNALPSDQALTPAIPQSTSTQSKMRLQKVARCFGVILIFAFMAWVLLMSLPKKPPHLSITHNFGIGFDLSPSYAYVLPIVLGRATNQVSALSPSHTQTGLFNQLPELRVMERTGR